MKKKVISVLLAAALAVGMLAGCGSSSSSTESAKTEEKKEEAAEEKEEAAAEEASGTVKDELVVVLKGEPSNVDPHCNGELVAQTTQVQIYETLVKKDADGNIIPCLAESWEQLDDTTIQFHLRDDVYFHNGEKLTADDVEFSIKRATEKPNSSAMFAAFDPEKTVAVDELTVNVATKKPFAAVYNYLCSTRGQILNRKAVETAGDDEYARNPVGTGPFKFDNWVTGTSITLVRNEEYWGEKPAYSKLTEKFISETANRALEIESGNADIVLDPDTTDLDRLKEVEGIQVVTGDSYGMSFIVFTMDDEVLSDVRVREALSLALDIPSIVTATYGNYASVNESVMPGTVLYYKSQGTREYNIEKAKELLADAGYADGLTLQLALPEDSEKQSIGIIAQNMWAEIGVTAEITTSSTSDVLAAGRRGDNQIAVMASTYSTGDPGHALTDFDSRSDGWFKPNDAHIDELLDAGSAAFDDADRKAVYEELQEYIYNNYYLIGVANKTVNYLITDKVTNFYCDPGDIPSFAAVVCYE